MDLPKKLSDFLLEASFATCCTSILPGSYISDLNACFVERIREVSPEQKLRNLKQEIVVFTLTALRCTNSAAQRYASYRSRLTGQGWISRPCKVRRVRCTKCCYQGCTLI